MELLLLFITINKAFAALGITIKLTNETNAFVYFTSHQQKLK